MEIWKMNKKKNKIDKGSHNQRLNVVYALSLLKITVLLNVDICSVGIAF
jgi:hypothetical protein